VYSVAGTISQTQRSMQMTAAATMTTMSDPMTQVQGTSRPTIEEGGA